MSTGQRRSPLPLSLFVEALHRIRGESQAFGFGFSLFRACAPRPHAERAFSPFASVLTGIATDTPLSFVTPPAFQLPLALSAQLGSVQFQCSSAAVMAQAVTPGQTHAGEQDAFDTMQMW